MTNGIAPRRPALHRLLVPVAAFALACGPSGAREAARDSLPDTPRAPLRLVPVVRLGCPHCTGPEQLAVGSVALDGEGRVYVRDRFEPFVRIFDSHGELQTAFGKFGHGPGELRRPSYLFVTETNQVLVQDRLGRRINLYEPTGELAREWQFPHFSITAAYDANRSRLIFVSAHAGAHRNDTGIYEFDLETEQVRPVVDFEDTLPKNSEGTATRYYPIAVSGDGRIAVGESESYAVGLFDLSGRRIATHARDIARTAKTRAELDLEELRIARERFAYVPDPLKLHFYASALNFDDEGRLWVLAGRSDTRQTIFDLFDADGYLGSVVAPGGIAIGYRYAIRGPYLVAIYRDESDDFDVRLFRIENVSSRR